MQLSLLSLSWFRNSLKSERILAENRAIDPVFEGGNSNNYLCSLDRDLKPNAKPRNDCDWQG